MESKTPRTDAETIDNKFFDPERPYEWVALDFAKQLETELADKDRQLAEAKAEIERLREKIKCCFTCKHYLSDNEMIGVCLNEARCCRTSAWCVIDRTSSKKRASWPDLWEENK